MWLVSELGDGQGIPQEWSPLNKVTRWASGAWPPLARCASARIQPPLSWAAGTTSRSDQTSALAGEVDRTEVDTTSNIMPHGPRGPAGPLSGSEGSQGGGWRAHLQVGDHPRVIIITIKTTTSGLWEAPTLSSGHTRRPKAEHFTFLIAFNPHFTNKESEAQRG